MRSSEKRDKLKPFVGTDVGELGKHISNEIEEIVRLNEAIVRQSTEIRDQIKANVADTKKDCGGHQEII